jgi:hypothetical protein
MRTRSLGGTPGLVALVAHALVLAFACAPPEATPEAGSTFTGGGSGGSGAGGAATAGGSAAGGALFDASAPPTCDAPSDPDGDQIASALEGPPGKDTDADGKPDAEDTDSDGDGYLDAEEAANALLNPSLPGHARATVCDAVADTDGDGTPDFRDLDSDDDGIPDAAETAYDPDHSKHCRVLVDCDGDGVIDVIEQAAGTNPADPSSKPADPGLYFVLPYGTGEQTKDFTFSAGVARADIYFLVDTTASMQPAIDALSSSLASTILPTILNGDLGAKPPIPPIDDAWIGIGTVGDLPWAPYGQPGDDAYRNSFDLGGQRVLGDVSAPVKQNGKWKPPASVSTILGSLMAAGGGDGPEGTTQALWLAATNQAYAAVGPNDFWNPEAAWSDGDPNLPYPAKCGTPGARGVPCFRPQSLPIFVLVSDAPFHDGPNAANDYGADTSGTRSYADAVAALQAIDAKVVGVPVAGGNPGAARADMKDLAEKTGSLWHDTSFGGSDLPLVPTDDVTTGAVSTEVVRQLGRLAGAGLHDVTTTRANYACAGGVDCDGDGAADPAYENPKLGPGGTPFDASTLITKVATVPSAKSPLPYASLDETSFYGVRGAAEVTFRVHARNDTLKPPALVVLRALIRVQTPTGQLLGGKNGVRVVYFVVPQHIEVPK